MKEFKGRIVASGTVTAKALVSHGGLNTLASFQKALQFGDKKATCGDQNNPDLYGKQMAGNNVRMPVIDSLGEEFLEYVKDDMDITVKEDGTVVVE